MGSRMKPTIFGDNVAKGIKNWQNTAKKNIKHGHRSSQNTPFSSRPGTPLHGSTSPIHLLHRHPDNSLESPPDSPREGWANESSSNDQYKYQEDRRDDQAGLEEGEIQEVGSGSGSGLTRMPSGHREVRRTQSEVAMSDFSFGQSK
ncbi:hypothetical protein L1987_52206 [Smallanthus sonchifolius]|uniref:Uncharacterized protein n=1 Tax=Smallanthus sonchifolius TaxID=185202 RepID=A0ACB9ERW6_9ASTR|nr:hypothetical protein L1987_52206 [Smallanthus sonchifolius]